MRNREKMHIIHVLVSLLQSVVEDIMELTVYTSKTIIITHYYYYYYYHYYYYYKMSVS